MDKDNQELKSVIEKLEAEKKQLEAKVKKFVDEAKKEEIKDKKGQVSVISMRNLTLNGKSLQNKDVVKMPNNADTKRAAALGLIKIIV